MISTGKLQSAAIYVVVLLWLGCFALQVRAVFNGQAFSSLNVSTPASVQDYPIVTGFVPYLGAEDSGLIKGDRLLRLGSADLRGAGPIKFWVLAAAKAGNNRTIPVVYERGQERFEAILPLGNLRLFWPFLPVSLVFATTSIVLLMRSGGSPMARAFAAAFMCAAFLFASQFESSEVEGYAAITVYLLAFGFNQPLWIRALLRFPDGGRPTSRLGRFGPWLLLAIAPFEFSRIFGTPFPVSVGYPVAFLGLAATSAIGMWIIRRAYRTSDAVGRRKLRIVLFGGYCTTIPPILGQLIGAYWPTLAWLSFLTHIAAASLPIALLIAIHRYNLFDIDRLIGATATYNTLAVLFLVLGFFVVPKSARFASALLDLTPSSGELVISLVLAAALFPVAKVARPWVDRVFVAGRYAVDQGFQELLIALPACDGAAGAATLAGESFSALFRPTTCTIFFREAQSYRASFATDNFPRDDISENDQLPSLLKEHDRPIVLTPEAHEKNVSRLSGVVKQRLTAVGAEVVVPARFGSELIGFICLGPKDSGDIYTARDLTLLTAVGGLLASKHAAADSITNQTIQDPTRGKDVPSLTETTATGRVHVGRYEILTQLGVGSGGAVYHAWDTVIGRTVALKLIDQGSNMQLAADEPAGFSAERRHRREVKAVGVLQHPNIVLLYDAGNAGGYLYLAMEYIDGGTLADELARFEKLMPARAVDVGIMIADALEFAHRNGVIHRDIKPANLLVSSDGVVKVADFGIAHLVASDLTVTSSFVGTPRYVSPEQLENAPIDGRADLFALGLVLYEALTGHHPFARASLAATISAILTYNPKPPAAYHSNIPASVSNAIVRMLEKDPSLRFSSAAEVASTLRNARRDLSQQKPDK